MPVVLPDFGTNIKNGHEERRKDHERQRSRQTDAEMRQAGEEMHVGRMMTD